MERRVWNVYLSGEIHSEWRKDVHRLAEDRDVPVRLTGPETHHERSDTCGSSILGPETDSFWEDHKAAKINTIRNRSVIQNSDIVVVRFGEKYRQWNAAFDAGLASGWGKSIITCHDKSLDHALKEVDAVALAVTRNVQQVVGILEYVTSRPF